MIISRVIYRKAISIKKENKIPIEKITYNDLNEVANPLFSKKYRISGKPDYIIKKNNKFIPIEVKTGFYNTPQKNHIFQLAAYCQLVEENYGNFVPHGILIYNNSYEFKIPFDPRLRFELESSINKMRNSLKTGKIIRNHNDPFKCKNCSMKDNCNSMLIQ